MKFVIVFGKEGGHEKLQLQGQGSLKTFVMKWRGSGIFLLSIEISSGPLLGIDND